EEGGPLRLPHLGPRRQLAGGPGRPLALQGDGPALANRAKTLVPCPSSVFPTLAAHPCGWRVACPILESSPTYHSGSPCPQPFSLRPTSHSAQGRHDLLGPDGHC